jgi:DNA-binding transcriptional ArsR family regulator
MNTKNKHLYNEKTLEFCRHARIISNVDRIYIIQVINEYQKCRVNQIVMETGLTIRQVYYQLSVLRKMNYITTKYDRGRYFVYPGFGMHRGKELLRTLMEINEMKEIAPDRTEYSHLSIV